MNPRGKKFSFIFFLFVVLPLTLALLNHSFADYENFRLGYDHVNKISTAAILIGIFGCIYILYLNQRLRPPIRTWNVVPFAILIFLSLYLYTLNSLSRFGF
jgi:hypothetical protein